MAVLRACRFAKSPTSRQLLRFQRGFSIVRLAATLSFSQQDGRFPKSWILRRNQISFAKFGNGKLARFVRIKMPRAVRAGHYLFIDFLLQSDEGMQKRFRTRRTSRDVHVHWNISINPLEHVVTLLERATGNCAGTHGNDVFRFGHLVVKPHHLRCHFLGDCARDNHQVRLPGRGTENLSTEARQVETRHRCRNHFNGAARQPELKRPDRVLSSPVVNGFERRGKNPTFTQLATQSFVDHCYLQVKTPLRHAQTSPSTSRSRKTIIAKNAPKLRSRNAVANGNKNIVSTSKIKKMMA